MPSDPGPVPEATPRSPLGRRWAWAFMLLVAGQMAVSAILLPASIDATLSRLPASADEADRRAVVEMLTQDEQVRLVFLPVRLGAGMAALAFWVKILCRLFTRKPLPRYRFFLAVVVQAELFWLLGRAAAAARSLWWPAADPAKNLLTPFSLADLLSPSAGHIAAVAGSAVSPFAAMTVVALALGLCTGCGFRPFRGALVAILAWAGGVLSGIGLLAAAQALLGAPL